MNASDVTLIVVFVASVLLVAYHHLVFPALLARLARRSRRSRPAPAVQEQAEPASPFVTLIVPAYNEAGVIALKIENLAGLDYDRDRLKIVLALDGCTDATRGVAEAALRQHGGGLDVEIVEYPENIGKIAVLNQQIARARAGIVALSDASALVQPDALRIARRHFADPGVGVVCGTYRLRQPGSEGERAYWAYQIRIKIDEAELAAPMGAHGAFYLIRRELWTTLPADTINDDFVLPMTIVASGYRAVYEREIVAVELERTKARQEFRRRERIGAGNLQQLVRLWRLADPRRPRLAFVFASGKGLRPLVPFIGIVAMASVAILAMRGHMLFQVFSGLGAIGLALAATVMSNRRAGWPRPLLWLGYFVEGHWASFNGAVRFLAGSDKGGWATATTTEGFLPWTVAASKRILDFVLALGATVLLAVLFIPIAIAIKLDSPGPIFYRQLRVGRSTPLATHIFWVIKLRTMREDAEKTSGPTLAAKDDPRVTRVGRFLRDTRIDELPQCINVLMGDMSVIGPRPERPGFFKKLEAAIPYYKTRTYGIRPGITGLAQVSQGYDTSIEDVKSKVTFDHAYAIRCKSWGSWLMTDLGIIFRTFGVMVRRLGQ